MADEMIEKIVMELVVNGGNARSKALSALKAARENQMDEAEKLMQECNESLIKAHNFQTSIIQETLTDENAPGASLIMVHGQDHIMNAMVVRELAEEMIEMYKMLHQLKKTVE